MHFRLPGQKEAPKSRAAPIFIGSGTEAQKASTGIPDSVVPF